MLAERFGFLEHADVHRAAVLLRQLRQLDRAREPRGPGTDDEHVQLHPVAGALGAVFENQPLER